MTIRLGRRQNHIKLERQDKGKDEKNYVQLAAKVETKYSMKKVK